MQIKISPSLCFFYHFDISGDMGFVFSFSEMKWYVCLPKRCVSVTSVSSLRCVGGWRWCQLCDAGMLQLSWSPFYHVEICQTGLS